MRKYVSYLHILDQAKGAQRHPTHLRPADGVTPSDDARAKFPPFPLPPLHGPGQLLSVAGDQEMCPSSHFTLPPIPPSLRRLRSQ